MLLQLKLPLPGPPHSEMLPLQPLLLLLLPQIHFKSRYSRLFEYPQLQTCSGCIHSLVFREQQLLWCLAGAAANQTASSLVQQSQ